MEKITHESSSGVRKISQNSQLARKLLKEHGKEEQIIFRRPPYAYDKLKKESLVQFAGLLMSD
ncbi:hypothetical protein ADIAL_0551 [Alkalibacterium sp. AK22]|nr:hypothetical protein ADIAL_0551 [Alkalibacterium sp. AK22]